LKKRPGKKGKSRQPVTSRSKRPAAKKRVSIVFLVGFMGAGKSTVGRALGRQLNWLFEDLDDRIERAEKRRVAEIFRDSGEPDFRRAEHAALRQVLEEHKGGVARVVALGGGAFVQKENAKLLQSAGVPTVFLEAPVDELWQRCRSEAEKNGTQRPLLSAFDEFRKLYRVRRKNYAKAMVRVETGDREIDAVTAEIVRRLGLKEIAMRTQQGEAE
jgi:shikimate kinase